MWCPDGCITFTEFRELCASYSTRYFRSFPEAETSIQSHALTYMYGRVAAEWLMQDFAYKGLYLVCSPRGQVLRADVESLIIAGGEVENVRADQYIYEPFEDASYPPKGWENEKPPQEMPLVDWQNGIIRGPLHGVEHFKKHVLSVSGDDEQTIQYFSDYWRKGNRLAQSFEGWAICAKNTVAHNYLKGRCTLDLPAENQDEVRGGRPRVRDAIAASYRKLFPQGHHPLPWKLVLDAIRRDTGLQVNVSTLKRGLIDNSCN